MLLAVVAWLVVDALSQERTEQSGQSLIKTPLLMLIAGTLTSFAWMFIQGLRATINPEIIPQNKIFKYDGIPPLKILFDPGNLLAWFPPGMGYDSGRFLNQYVSLMRSLAIPLLVGALIATAMQARKGNDIASLSLFAGITGLVCSPIFIIGIAITSGVHIGPSGRYGVCLLPAYVIAVASQSKGRVGDVLLGLIGGFAWIICSYAILVG
jgi:hypothetical protein